MSVIRRPVALRWGVVLPLLLAAVAQVELLLPHSADGAFMEPGNALVAALATLPLALAHRAPLVAPAAAATAWVVEPLVVPVSNTFAVPVSVLVVAPVLAVLGARTSRSAAWGAAVVVLLVGVQGVTDDRFGAGDAVANAVFAAVAATVGGVWRHSAARRRLAEDRVAAERRAREDADRALATERARIARELHDVVGHGISVVLLQARGARRVLDADPEQVRVALDEVERVAARALVEMRLLLGVLRPLPDPSSPSAGVPPAPQPGAGDLSDLVERVRATGTPVALATSPAVAQLPAGLGVSVYRIVQEALTNALRHASGAAVTVEVSTGEGGVAVEVTNARPPRIPPAATTGPIRPDDALAPGGGTGLLGVRERTEVFGGSFEAGPVPGGGYRLRTLLPLPLPSVLLPPVEPPAAARKAAR